MVKPGPLPPFFKARQQKEVRDYLTKYEIESGIIDKVVQHLKKKTSGWWSSICKQKPDRSQPSSGDRGGSSYYNSKFNKRGSQIAQEILQTMIFQEVIDRTGNKLLKIPRKISVKSHWNENNPSTHFKRFCLQSSKDSIPKSRARNRWRNNQWALF